MARIALVQAPHALTLALSALPVAEAFIAEIGNEVFVIVIASLLAGMCICIACFGYMHYSLLKQVKTLKQNKEEPGRIPQDIAAPKFEVVAAEPESLLESGARPAAPAAKADVPAPTAAIEAASTPVAQPLKLAAVHPVKVSIVGARGLSSGGGSNMRIWCKVEIPFKPHSQLKTPMIDSFDPTWEHEGDVAGYAPGDGLVFTVLSSDPQARRDDVIGRVTLAAHQFHPQGFDGEVPLTSAGGSSPQHLKASLKVRVSAAGWAYGDKAFFGAYWLTGHRGIGGMRNDFEGEVGFRFLARTPLVLNALGRQINAGLDDPSSHTALVTLWSEEKQMALASVEVGVANSSVGSESGFAFGLLREELVLEAGKKYRISQQCSQGMADYWFDGAISPTDLAMWSATHCAEFLGSCYREGRGYPVEIDNDSRIPTQFRRAGMLNFRMRGEDPSKEGERRVHERSLVRRGDRREDTGGGADHEDMLQIRLVCMSPAPQDLSLPRVDALL